MKNSRRRRTFVRVLSRGAGLTRHLSELNHKNKKSPSWKWHLNERTLCSKCLSSSYYFSYHQSLEFRMLLIVTTSSHLSPHEQPIVSTTLVHETLELAEKSSRIQDIKNKNNWIFVANIVNSIISQMQFVELSGFVSMKYFWSIIKFLTLNDLSIKA